MKTKGERNMKRIILTSLLATLFTCGSATARTVIVKIDNVRGEKGTVLVMAQAGKEDKPVYGMAKAQNGTVVVKLENVGWEQFDVSVFHDENDNWEMDLTEEKRPAEGYARKNCKVKAEEETVRLKLYYPVTE